MASPTTINYSSYSTSPTHTKDVFLYYFFHHFLFGTIFINAKLFSFFVNIYFYMLFLVFSLCSSLLITIFMPLPFHVFTLCYIILSSCVISLDLLKNSFCLHCANLKGVGFVIDLYKKSILLWNDVRNLKSLMLSVTIFSINKR